MKEKQPYQSIRNLLERTSLKPRKADWDQMNSLLNKHLPPTGIHVNPLKLIKYVTGGASVILVTVSVTYLNYKHPDKSKKLDLTFKSESFNQTGTESNQATAGPVISKYSYDSALHSSGNNSPENHFVQSEKRKPEKDSVASYFSETHQNSDRQHGGLLSAGIDKENKLLADKLPESNRLPIHTNNNPEASLSKKETSPVLKKISPPASEIHSWYLKRKSRLEKMLPVDPELQVAEYSINPFNTGSWLPPNPAALLISTNITNSKGKKQGTMGRTLSENKTNAGHATESTGFAYGLNLPLLQLYTSKGIEPLRINYVPGLNAGYFFNRRLGVGLSLNPYQTLNTSSKDSIFSMLTIDSSISINRPVEKKYYLQDLNVFNLNVHIEYRVNNRLGIEFGVGYQQSYNGNGFIVSRPGAGYGPNISIPNQNIHYTRNDTVFAQIEKSNFYYYLNTAYSIRNFDILLGYNQNLKSWINSPSSKPTGWISLEFRYFFSRPTQK